MPLNPDLVRQIFQAALNRFLVSEIEEILDGVNERANCGRLAIYLQDAAREHGLPKEYLVDVEYNRKQNGQIKTIINDQGMVVRVNCDVILHSRGVIIGQDNLIAIEMKKSDRPKFRKQHDRERLQALTKINLDDVYGDPFTVPEHVCGYFLGVFIELNRRSRTCHVEYYKEGELQEEVRYPLVVNVVAEG